MQGMRVWSLVGELKSHMPQGNYAGALQTTEPPRSGAHVWQLTPKAAKNK